MRHHNRQRGVGFLGLLFIFVIGGFAVLVGLKLVPVYLESFKIDTALNGVIESPNVSEQSKREIIMSVLRRLDIDEVRRIHEQNYTDYLSVEKNDGRVTITIVYDDERELFGNISLVAKFHKEVSN